ncbi:MULTISPECIES: TIGR01212 family radical SAM protein [unclassified Fusibacter]|uniref:TIGR01212 family radical SAM protein n=1 Tax=unclassified Fusibacter TaxID=2624464 RepID=UPI001011DE7B|nr:MULTISPECIES: TIGR01212 family radical SAM protein [unclassified Fusibacter]MCK8060705.1 TIGR01212 family radical SAM protein [Fusibacter sp. A2]NPE22841.1 TIGR01212 family radical SAM protein [Fusibacter sp. A1]RXV59910.1 TIGR01212 family radical SAM protein [Fusibacter sp. A1]
MTYYRYSDYLKDMYQQKVYKLPVNLPVTCPNRDGAAGSGGCIFCSEIGAGFEMLEVQVSVVEQLRRNMSYIKEKYKAEKFIAYFQNYSNTYLPVDEMMGFVQAATIENIVEICLSTRPDCLSGAHLEALAKFKQETGLAISIELGLQSVNDETLRKINRGHDVACFVHAVNKIKEKGFQVGVHLIPNLPWDTKEDIVSAARLMSALEVDTVKLHSLYVLKGTELARLYEEGSIEICGIEEYYERIILFLRHLSPRIGVQRFFGRAPKDQTLFCNWSRSWRYLQDELDTLLVKQNIQQGDRLKWSVYE